MIRMEKATMRKHLLVTAVAGALAVGAAPAPASAQQPCGGTYTIRTGDTLTEIAARCGVTVPALLAANPGVRDDQDLGTGGSVRIPTAGTRPTPVEACGGFYTLRQGDTLQEVAEKCGLTVPLLIAANPGVENPERVRAGGTIRIPDLPPVGAGFQPVILGGAQPPVADTVAADSAEIAIEPVPYVRYEGVLRQGRRCAILRTADGAEVGIAGELGPGFDIGDRVAVTGPAAPTAACGTDRAVTVRIMWRPGARE